MAGMGSVLRNFEEKWITLVLDVFSKQEVVGVQPIMWLIQAYVLLFIT